MARSLLLRGIFVSFLFWVVTSQDIYDGLVNTNVDRNIDLTSQIAKHTTTIKLTNSGSRAVNQFHLALDPEQTKHLASLEVFQDSGARLQVSKSQNAPSDAKYNLWTVDAGQSIAAGSSITVRVVSAFTHTMSPFPAAIGQSERQYVRYYDNHYFFSPYATTTQTTTVKVPTSTIESKSELAPTSVKGETITYGPYENVKPFSTSAMSLHFENNKPFITVTYLQRDIEISHWGNIAVEESYLMQHDGAKLKGTFSRFDYQRNPRAPAHVPQLTEILPANAADVYYRDDIGNISTSHLSLREKGQTLELTPRFPLFGGWKIGFYLGYNLPSQDYLFSDANEGGRYMLNISFAPTFTDDSVIIDQLVTRIVLPEGARDFEAIAPFPLDKQSTETFYTYLDTSGRPVLVVEKRNVLASDSTQFSHAQNFQVVYRFRTLSMLQEPFLLMAAYFTFFILMMLWARTQFKIAPVKERSVHQDRIDDLISRFRDIVDARTELFESLDRALSNVLSSKNINQYTNERKTAEVNLASLRKEANLILKELEDLPLKAGDEVARRVREIERRAERREKAQLSQHTNEIDFRVKGAIREKAYNDAKNENERALHTAEDELDSSISDLAL